MNEPGLSSASVIVPDWPAPEQVRAFSSTRMGGVSAAPFDSLNLGHAKDGGGDQAQSVANNRQRLREGLDLPTEPVWLQQVHGRHVAYLDGDHRPAAPPQADAAMTRARGVPCVVLTADCLPVLLCDHSASVVAAVHGGWRGLARGILARAVDALGRPGAELLAWLGPAIGPQAFEVGPEVRAAFIEQDAALADCFVPNPNAEQEDRLLADLYGIARHQLAAAGIEHVFGGDRCTFSEPEHFFSYRRDGQTGRMATLIWLS